MVAGSDQISKIQSCAREEFASYLSLTDIHEYNKNVPEPSCWDGQLRNKTSDLCLDTDLLVWLMAMNGIRKGSDEELTTEEEVSVPADSRLLSTLCKRVKRGMRRKRPVSRQYCDQCSCAVDVPSSRSRMQPAASICSTATSEDTVVHNDIFKHRLVKSRSTTNILRLIEAAD